MALLPSAEDFRVKATVESQPTCVCGKGKKKGKIFCTDCYLDLPLHLQRPLWKIVGFQAAYAAAKELLS